MEVLGMTIFSVSAIASVKNSRREIEDDNWGEVVSIIELDPSLPEEALFEIESFSHAEIIYYFHLVDDTKVETGSRHPRNNKEWPKVGILSQRGKNRPNRLGATIVKILKREGRHLHVQGLDAIDGTPILDIKPVMREFLPREEVTQPEWATKLMKHYW
jgi:tRNA-Thr(GGU) m(6)t(6)A37 methyltransferase TsaA